MDRLFSNQMADQAAALCELTKGRNEKAANQIRVLTTLYAAALRRDPIDVVSAYGAGEMLRVMYRQWSTGCVPPLIECQFRAFIENHALFSEDLLKLLPSDTLRSRGAEL